MIPIPQAKLMERMARIEKKWKGKEDLKVVEYCRRKVDRMVYRNLKRELERLKLGQGNLI